MKNFFKLTTKESSVQTSIKKHLKDNGWFVTKLISTSTAGIPDLMAIKDGQTIFVEVKRKGGRTSAIQDYRIDELRQYGVKVFVSDSLDQFKSYLEPS